MDAPRSSNETQLMKTIHLQQFFGRRITAGAAIFLSAFLIYLLTLNSVWATDHTTSFLQLDWAIWVHHSFVVGSGSQLPAEHR